MSPRTFKFGQPDAAIFRKMYLDLPGSGAAAIRTKAVCLELWPSTTYQDDVGPCEEKRWKFPLPLSEDCQKSTAGRHIRKAFHKQMKPFADRFQAGRILASKLASYRERPNAFVLALPRGGVPVAYEIAKELYIDMDVFLVGKLPIPTNPELSMGSITSGGTRILDEGIVQALAISPDVIDAVADREQKQLVRWERFYRRGRSPLAILGRCVILVDDGLASGTTMKAAAVALRKQQAARIVVAVPIGSREACSQFDTAVDEIICDRLTDPFHAVGSWYENFAQVTDEDVGLLLRRVSSIKASTPAAKSKTL